MASEKLRNIRNWLLRNGRYLETSLWNYHFEGGGTENVLKALAVYQNRDGGFGNGIEPDINMPISDNISTSAAIRILKSIGFPAESKPMTDRILRFLTKGGLTEGYFIPVPNEIMDYPHAQHWDKERNPSFGYNPSAELIGFIYSFTDSEETRKKCLELISGIYEKISSSGYIIQPHELSSVIMMSGYLLKNHEKNSETLYEKLYEYISWKIKLLTDTDPHLYRNDNYYTPPSLFLDGRNDPFFKDNEEISTWYAKYLEDSVTEQGFWELNWTLGKYSMDPITKNQWRGILTVRNMVFLEGMKPQGLTIKDSIKH